MNESEVFRLIDEKKDRFEKFYDILVENNKFFNLTSITEKNEVYVKHFYDSVYASDLFDKNVEIIEVGSGGGFPSVPLKIVREDLCFTLLEATNKKCVYLSGVKEKLNFENFSVICGRAEEKGKNELREKFDYSVARAVAPLRTLSEYLLPLVKVGGTVVCYKGSDFEREAEESKNAIRILGGKIENILTYDLPREYGGRSLIIIKKISPTPQKYPRGMGKEKKCPL